MARKDAPLHRQFLASALAGDRVGALGLVDRMVEEGASLEHIYLDVFRPALREVGDLWRDNRISVAHEHFVSTLVQASMSALYDRLFDPAEGAGGLLLAGSVEGEHHQIGVRMIADLMQVEGWDTHFLGGAVAATRLGRAAADLQPELVALSASMSARLPAVATAVAAAREANPEAIIAVGGRPFLQKPELFRDVGADLTAEDAATLIAQLPGDRPDEVTVA